MLTPAWKPGTAAYMHCRVLHVCVVKCWRLIGMMMHTESKMAAEMVDCQPITAQKGLHLLAAVLAVVWLTTEPTSLCRRSPITLPP